MKGLIILVRWLTNFLFKIKKLIPPGLIGIFVLFNFFVNLKNLGFIGALKQAAEALFAAEVVINEVVNSAINNSASYSFGSVLNLIGALLTIYFFVKWLTKANIAISGSQAYVGSLVVALFILALIELVAIVLLHGTIDFIPIKDGIVFLFLNLDYVFYNFHFFGRNVTTPIGLNETTTIDVPIGF